MANVRNHADYFKINVQEVTIYQLIEKENTKICLSSSICIIEGNNCLHVACATCK